MKEKVCQILSDLEIIEEEVRETLESMTLKEASKKTNLFPQYISNYLNGHINISKDKLLDIAKNLWKTP